MIGNCDVTSAGIFPARRTDGSRAGMVVGLYGVGREAGIPARLRGSLSGSRFPGCRLIVQEIKPRIAAVHRRTSPELDGRVSSAWQAGSRTQKARWHGVRA
jgi:hypothetical protein